MSALMKQICKRPIHPQGEMVYRVATVAAALLVLVAAPFF